LRPWFLFVVRRCGGRRGSAVARWGRVWWGIRGEILLVDRIGVHSFGSWWIFLYIFLNYFAKIYDGLKILHFSQPFAVSHGGRGGPRRFQDLPLWPRAVRMSPWATRLQCTRRRHEAAQQPPGATTVARGIPSWTTTVACGIPPWATAVSFF
jgi:hypothetical protein